MTHPASVRGRVYQLNRKGERPDEHGLPKVAAPEVRVTVHGVEGDFNRYRHEEKHDDPRMALLIMPIETIEQFNREGWPGAPGRPGGKRDHLGNSVRCLRARDRIRIGSARVEITEALRPLR